MSPFLSTLWQAEFFILMQAELLSPASPEWHAVPWGRSSDKHHTQPLNFNLSTEGFSH